MKLKFFLMFCFGIFPSMVESSQQCLLMFQHEFSQELNDVDGMNIGHQFITALMQKSCPILVSQNVWNHVVERCARCEKKSAVPGSRDFSARQLIDTVQALAKNTQDAVLINQRLNQNWYEKNFGDLKQLDGDTYKSVFFDQLCLQLPQFLSSWQGYVLHNGYILLLTSQADRAMFHIPTSATLLDGQLHHKLSASLKIVDLVNVLSQLLNKKVTWSFYLTGHGQHEQEVYRNIVAGVFVDQFKNLLLLLNSAFNTNILVYSSCYSSGMHLVMPYTQGGKELRLKYPVIVTCLTDAPVYVMGYPAGLKLPPYDTTFDLQASDIAADGLNWSMMQNFKEFCRLCKLKMNLQDIAQSVTVYQECQMGHCSLSQIENIPLVRKAKETFFVPLDSKYVQCIVHDSSSALQLGDKQGLLWYCKRYHGTIVLSHVVPQFVSMLPEDAAILVHAVDAKNSNLHNFIKTAFFSIDDLQKTQIFLCDTLTAKDGVYQRVMILPKSLWVPGAIRSGELGVCLYQKDHQFWSLAFDENKQAVPQLLSHEQKKQAVRLWQLLMQDAQRDTKEGTTILSAAAVHRNVAHHANLLRQCQKEQICPQHPL